MSDFNVIDIIDRMKTIQESLYDMCDNSVTYADVTNSTLSDVFSDMGYSIGQLPDGSWGMVKTTTPYAEVVNNPKALPAVVDSASKELTSVEIINVTETVGGKASPKLGATATARAFMGAVPTAATIATMGGIALYFGYKLKSGAWEDSSASEILSEAARVIFGTPTPYQIEWVYDADGNLTVPEEMMDRAYDEFVALGDEALQKKWVDPDGDESVLGFSNSVGMTYEWDGGNYYYKRSIVMTAAEGCKFEVGHTAPSGGTTHNIKFIGLAPFGTNTFSYTSEWTTEMTSAATGETHIDHNTFTYTVGCDYSVGRQQVFGSGENPEVFGTTEPLRHGYLDDSNRWTDANNFKITPNILSNPYAPSPNPTQPNRPWYGANWTQEGVIDMEEIPGTLHPVLDGSIQGTYPDWYAKRHTINCISSSRAGLTNPGLQDERKYYPFTMPEDSFITTSNSQTVNDLHDATFDLEELLRRLAEAIKTRIGEDQDEKADDDTDAGNNPVTPTPTDGGETDDPGEGVPIEGPESTGFTAIYHPSRANVVSFSQWLWSVGFNLDTFKKLFQDPMSAIISLHMIYATPSDAGNKNIVVGYLDSGVLSNYVTDTVIELNCGTVKIPEYYGNALDYNPYTDFVIYLPFVGFRSLNANDIVGASVNVTYNIDVVTGTLVAFVYVIRKGFKAIMYSFEGNCAVQIPLSSANFSSIISSVLSSAVSVGAAFATGGAAAPIAAASIANSVLNSKVNVERGGALSGNAGALAPKKPYIIAKRPISKVAYKYQEIMGYPASSSVVLSTCSGFTRIKEIILDGIQATQKEKIALEALLKNGVEF